MTFLNYPALADQISNENPGYFISFLRESIKNKFIERLRETRPKTFKPSVVKKILTQDLREELRKLIYSYFEISVELTIVPSPSLSPSSLNNTLTISKELFSHDGFVLKAISVFNTKDKEKRGIQIFHVNEIHAAVDCFINRCFQYSPSSIDENTSNYEFNSSHRMTVAAKKKIAENNFHELIGQVHQSLYNVSKFLENEETLKNYTLGETVLNRPAKALKEILNFILEGDIINSFHEEYFYSGVSGAFNKLLKYALDYHLETRRNNSFLENERHLHTVKWLSKIIEVNILKNGTFEYKHVGHFNVNFILTVTNSDEEILSVMQPVYTVKIQFYDYSNTDRGNYLSQTYPQLLPRKDIFSFNFVGNDLEEIAKILLLKQDAKNNDDFILLIKELIKLNEIINTQLGVSNES